MDPWIELKKRCCEEASMEATISIPDDGLVLDIFGQRLVTIFTQISSCFALPDDRNTDDIVNTIKHGVERLSKAFPWVCGQVVCEGAGEGNSGVFKIKPLVPLPRLHVKDARHDPTAPSMEYLRQTGFPMNVLNQDLVAPRKTSSGNHGHGVLEVFTLQVTFLKGGVVLTFLGHHQVMDGIGLDEVIRLLSKACQGDTFTEEELRVGNFAPENIALQAPEDSWSPGPELEFNIIKTDASQPGPGRGDTKGLTERGSWSHFAISPQAVLELKDGATKTLPKTSKYISTDDALSAFVWQSILRARSPQLDAQSETLFARAVDLRRYMGISPTHPGFIQSMTYHAFSVEQLIAAPLGVIAADLRKEVDPETSNLAHHSRSFSTLIHRAKDTTTTSYLAGFDTSSSDVMLSSWVNQKSYEMDFGLGLGKPEAVRRPRFDSFPGLVYLLPRAPDGEVGIAVCLNARDMEALKTDEEFGKYARFVG